MSKASRKSGSLRSFFAAKAASILLGLLAIPVLFYSLGGMFGKTPDWVNIAIFFLADALLYFMSFRLLTRGALRGGEHLREIPCIFSRSGILFTQNSTPAATRRPLR